MEMKKAEPDVTLPSFVVGASASHGFNHKLADRCHFDDLKSDITDSKKLL